jgi:hypothetical protein
VLIILVFLFGVFCGWWSDQWHIARREAQLPCMLACATCHRFMDRKGLTQDGSEACFSADGRCLYSPTDCYEAPPAELKRFANAHGWLIQEGMRPPRHLCPGCRERAAKFRQEVTC